MFSRSNAVKSQRTVKTVSLTRPFCTFVSFSSELKLRKATFGTLHVLVGARLSWRGSLNRRTQSLLISVDRLMKCLSIELTGCIWFHLIIFCYIENGVGRQHSSKLTFIPKLGWSNSTVSPFCVIPVDICVKSLSTWSNPTVLKSSNDQFLLAGN